MLGCPKCSSPSAPPPSVPPPPSIFSPEFLACLDERDEVPSAAESDRSGPWKAEALPGRPGQSGWTGVFRAWEDPAQGDLPRARFEHEEDAELCAVALPLLGREPRSCLGEIAGEEGFPLLSADGERGVRAGGALALYELDVAAALHLLQGLVRSPAALAGVIAAAGPGALAQAGRLLAERWRVGR
jgi:hypothetical protein